MDQQATGVKQQVVIRAKTGKRGFLQLLGIYIADWQAKNLEQAYKVTNDASLSNSVLFSSDGKYLLVQEKQRAFSINVDDHKTIGQLEGVSISNIAISPCNRFAQVMEKVSVDQFKLHLVEFPSLKPVEVTEHKRYVKEMWPLIKFTGTNDKYMVRIENKELQVIDSDTLKLIRAFDCKNCEHVSVQPTQSEPFLIVTYQLSKDLSLKDNQAHLMIFYFNKTALPIFQKSMERASEIDACWSPDGSNLLLLASQNQDTSNQSYYGQTQVFHFNKDKREFKIIPTYEGPVHSVRWAPDSQSFIIISGFMPAGMVQFTREGVPTFEFGKDHKNEIYWSPLGRFVLLCGFGNLDGSIDVWDVVQKKQVGKCQAKSTCTRWSSCGRKFLVGKVAPHMNVDNCYQLFDYQGVEILKHSFTESELYEAQFRPFPKGTFQDRPPSPPRNPLLQAKEQPKKLFIPPGGSGALAQQIRMQRQAEGARQLNANENFGNSQQQGWGLAKAPQNLPVGAQPLEEKKEKKKRIRHKKNKDDLDDKDDV